MLQALYTGQQNQGSLDETFDIVQARYGWSDEYILDLPYARFQDLIKTVQKARSSEADEQLQIAAFIGWQYHISTTPKSMSLKKWLARMGIGKKDTEPATLQEVAKARSIEREMAGYKWR